MTSSTPFILNRTPMTMARRFLPLTLLGIFLLSFGIYSRLFQNLLPSLHHWPVQEGYDTSGDRGKISPPTKTQLDLQVDALYDQIERLIPNAPFTFFNRSTSAKNSKAVIANPRKQYCVGEDLVVRLDMYDYLGHRKTYGGDFLRPRLFSPDLGAAVSGVIEDFGNGSYNVRFPLYWNGSGKVSILVFHPSEGVAALWRVRHASLGVVGFRGKFEKHGKEAIIKCGFKLEEKKGKEICEYADPVYEEAFYCYKEPNFTCESLKEMSGYYLPVSYLTADEKKLFERSNIAIEIPTFEPITVSMCTVVNYFRYHEGGWSGWDKSLQAFNLEHDIYVSYKRHGFPLEHPAFYYFKEDMYTSRQIDQHAGGNDTIFMITMGQHFRMFPLKIFIKRALNIRRAVEKLFVRSPDTKVIIKSENIRELYSPVEMQGDFHGYTQYLVLRKVFQGLNVGFVDAWDMTVASASYYVHPREYTFANIMSLAFSFACP